MTNAITPTALDDYIISQMRFRQTKAHLDDAQMAERLGLGRVHYKALLDGRSTLTSKDVLQLGALGFDFDFGALSDRRDGRFVRPMVFEPEEDDVVVERSAAGYEAGIDVHCEDVDGRPCTVKLSRGVARAIALWMQEHDPQ